MGDSRESGEHVGGVGGARVFSVLCSPAAIQEAWEDANVWLLLSVRGRQVGLTGGLSRMHCAGEPTQQLLIIHTLWKLSPGQRQKQSLCFSLSRHVVHTSISSPTHLHYRWAFSKCAPPSPTYQGAQGSCSQPRLGSGPHTK